MSHLHDAVHDYLSIRRALGYKLKRHGLLLPDFVTFVEREGSDFITTELALRWAMQPSQTSPVWYARRLGMVRLFARHVRSIDPRTEIPPPDLLPCRKRRGTPYLYSDQDVATLLAAARSLRPPLRASTYATLLGLLATSGLRVGEAIALDREDVDWRAGLLVVRQGKFGKSRQIPLHETTMRALRIYADERSRTCPRLKAPSFFVSTRGTRLIYNNVHKTFLDILGKTRLATCSTPRRPRLHDLRHSFAVATVLGWYRAGLDVESRLPLLSTYLGHVCPSNTYWYLTATTELLGHASARLERAWEGLS